MVLSNSRGPQNLKDLVKELGPHARAATPAGAAAEGGLVVVVVSIPPRAYPAPRSRWPAVLDTIHYMPQRDRRIPGLGGSLSSSDVLQRHLGMAHVVEVFSKITFWTSPRWLVRRARPTVAPCRSPGTTRPRRRR